jgi:hypothetical protein
MKHGPIALDRRDRRPAVFLVPQGGDVREGDGEPRHEIAPAAARSSPWRPRATPRSPSLADDVIYVPKWIEAVPLTILIDIVPLQLLRVSHRGGARLRCGQAAEPGEERDGGVVIVAGKT